MITDVRRRLEENPFQAFSIVMSSGMRYRVPSRDHAGFDPKGTRLVIWFDDSSSVVISGLHIVAIEEDASTATQPA